MKITTQKGEVVNAHDIEISGSKIQCTPDYDHRRRIVCGIYNSRRRATEIFSEMTCEGWNNENPQYVMPQN